MGVDFYSKEASYSCSYGSWHTVRLEVLYATIRYLKYKKDLIEAELKKLNEKDEDDDEDEQTYYILKKEYDNICYVLDSLSDYKPPTDGKVDLHTLDNFVNKCKDHPRLVDCFIYFDINGLYALLSKSDCEGYYSVGNSVDIYQLLDIISDFIEDKIVKSRMKDGVIRLFKDSVKHNSKITIA